MTNLNKFLIVNEAVAFVKGYKRCAVYDTQRYKTNLIENDLYDFVMAHNKLSLNQIEQLYDEESQDTIKEYIDYLQNEEYVFIGTQHDASKFSPMDLDWDTYSTITNCIIEYSRENLNYINDIINQMDNLGVQAIEFICYDDSITIKELNTLITLFSECQNLTSLNFYIKYIDDYKDNNIITYLENPALLKLMIIHSSPYDYADKKNQIYYTKQSIYDFNSCGIVEVGYFSPNLWLFSESQTHNTCLNRKLSIDAEGNIKNCLSMQQSFGNIKDTTLQEAIQKQGFKSLWFIHKDQIDVCKDCEFRHMCTDCRCFIDDPENICSRPAKCTYNPYIAKWVNEEGYIPVAECGMYTKETGFIPNHEKIATLNNEIWGE